MKWYLLVCFTREDHILLLRATTKKENDEDKATCCCLSINWLKRNEKKDQHCIYIPFYPIFWLQNKIKEKYHSRDGFSFTWASRQKQSIKIGWDFSPIGHVTTKKEECTCDTAIRLIQATMTK